jgi:hypothetical protein
LEATSNRLLENLRGQVTRHLREKYFKKLPIYCFGKQIRNSQRFQQRQEAIDAGFVLATEKLTTHWNVVRELADLLVEEGVIDSENLLSLFERHGLSSA